MIAMSVASTAATYAAQKQAANRQAEYQNQVYNQQAEQAIAQAEYQNRQVTRNNEYILQNRDNAIAALTSDRQALVSQERQQSIATALDIQQKRMEAMRARGSLAASEKSGANLETLMGDYFRQEAQYRQITSQNAAFATAQRVRQNEALVTTANSRINEARPYEAAPFQSPTLPAPVSGPSLLGTVLSGATGVANTVSSRSTFDPTRNRYVIDRMRTTNNLYTNPPNPPGFIRAGTGGEIPLPPGYVRTGTGGTIPMPPGYRGGLN